MDYHLENKENEMGKEVTKKASTEVAPVDLDAFGGGNMSSEDVVIPKVLTMQGLSKLVTEGKAKFGDFVDSLNSEVLGDIEKGLEFIPFHLEKTWVVSRKEGNRYMFDHTEPVTAANENKKWEEVIDGKEYKNEKAFNFYCIMPHDPSIPYLLQFKSTSLKAGRELATQMYIKNRAAGKVPPAKVMVLSGSRISNDKGTFAVLKTGIERDSSQEEIMNCLEWFKTISAGGAKVHDEGAAQAQDTKPQF